MKILMPDGTEFDQNKEIPMSAQYNATQAHTEAGRTNAAAAAASSEPTRTRLQIATDLDTAEREVTAAQLAVAEASQKVRDLARELKNYGVKRRAPKGDK